MVLVSQLVDCSKDYHCGAEYGNKEQGEEFFLAVFVHFIKRLKRPLAPGLRLCSGKCRS